VACRSRVAVDDLADLGGGERARLALEPQARNRRRSDRGSLGGGRDLLAPTVEQLDEQPRTVGLHRLREPPIRRHDLRQEATDRVRREQPGRMDGGRLEEDRAGPAPRTRLVVGEEVVRREMVVDEAGLVRGRNDPVTEFDRPEVDRGQQGRKRVVRGHARIIADQADRGARPVGASGLLLAGSFLG